jgi:hypothetical protein
MEYKNKTKAELGAELVKLRKQTAKLGKNNSKPQKTEKTLIENGTKFHTLVESAQDAIFTVQGAV